MDKLIFILSFCVISLAQTITVSASVDGVGYRAKKEAKTIAKQLAIKKYILQKNKSISNKTIQALISNYSDYIIYATLQDINRQNGKTTALYDIEVDDDLINKKLLKLGEGIQGLHTNFIIIEEPIDFYTIDFFSKEDFIIYYNILQKQIKDIITKKMLNAGFKTEKLDNLKNINKFKEKEPNLTGVYYDFKRKKYITDTKFIDFIKQTYPSAILIKYKIEFLSIIKSKIKATLSLKLQDLETDIDIPIGNLSYTVPMDGFSFNSIKYSFLEAISNIVSLISNQVTLKVNELIETRNNMPSIIQVKTPTTRIAYKIKRAIKNNKNISDIVISHNVIKFYFNGNDLEEFIYDKFLPIVEDKINKIIDDKFIFINGKRVNIDVKDKSFNIKNIKILFI